MKLTQRERWLMDRAFLAGRGTWDTLEDWLRSERVRPGTTSHELLVQILLDEAPPATIPVDYAALPRQLPAGFGQGVALERMVLAQHHTNELLREINSRLAVGISNAARGQS